MPKPRKAENKGLPARWTRVHGAYFYRVPLGLESEWDGKKMFRLGKSLPEAYEVWSKRIGRPKSVHTIAQLLDRYLLEVVPKKSPETASSYARMIKRLRSIMGANPIATIEPQHIYQYVEGRTEFIDGEVKRQVQAHREVEVLSNAFTMAVKWGYLKRHPFSRQVRLEGEPPRTRYVEDWEVIEALSLTPRRKTGSVLMIQAYIRLKLLTGLSRGDLLRLQPARHFKDDGIHVQRHKTKKKTGKRTIYKWTPERREAVAACLAARPVDLSPFLFCTKMGTGYMNEAKGTASTFNNIWQGFIARVLDETKVTERFTEHDLRAKCASDAESLDKARALLAHVDSRVTERVYRRKPEVV